MLGLIKSIGNKAISSLPVVFTSSKIKINTPHDDKLEEKLQEISSQILKTEPNEQFKIYQQLQSQENADFNHCLRKIYEHEECTTESINAIIRFYTFLLTNCKNELVICKLVSEPLVIELTKIVLHVDGNNDEEVREQEMEETVEEGEDQKSLDADIMDKNDLLDITENKEEQHQSEEHIKPIAEESNDRKETTTTLSCLPTSASNHFINAKHHKKHITSLHYTNYIDWDEVNAYKVALIRAYINCINAETINYMIVDNELPIFVNCVNGYKHYLTEGVEGTCISNCILMILTKVNHNDEVCGIVFDEKHHVKHSHENNTILMEEKQIKEVEVLEKLSKSISIEKPIKLHEFIQEVIIKISLELEAILKLLNENSLEEKKESQSIDSIAEIEELLKYPRKLESHMEFIESNILFCVDLINSINNYNYTSKIKSTIGNVIEKLLIGKVVEYVQKETHKTNHSITFEKEEEQKLNETKNTSIIFSKLNLIVMKIIKYLLNLSITCQKEQLLINFLNNYAPVILSNIISMNELLFQENLKEEQNNTFSEEQIPNEEQENVSEQISTNKIVNPDHEKHILTYICDYSLILLKQVMSPHSQLASRKRLEQNNQELLLLKETMLEKLFIILEKMTKYETLKEGVCYKLIRNMLLAVFYLTIKEDKCSVENKKIKNSSKKKSVSKRSIELPNEKTEISLSSPENTESELPTTPTKINNIELERNELPIFMSPPSLIDSPTKSHNPNTLSSSNPALSLSFNYSILLLHKTFTLHFKKFLTSNANWEFIVNNYETLMREVPNTILSPEESDKYCHYHNNNNYQIEDKIRDQILVYEAVRNYRYMIIHQTTLESRLIRLENIYHKHFLSPGWGYTPGEIITFNSPQEYKIVCTGLLHNNNLMKLPIEILHDSECLLITHKEGENKSKIIANIRYKKVGSFVPEAKGLIRMKLIGIQELILEFGSAKMLQTFKEYLSENRNKTREKELKFINYYLNLYLKDTEDLINKIYEKDIAEDDEDIIEDQNDTEEIVNTEKLEEPIEIISNNYNTNQEKEMEEEQTNDL